MRVKMNSALGELRDKVEMFNGAEDALAKKDAEINKLAGKLRTNTNLMHAFELEKDGLMTRMNDATAKIRLLEETNAE